jgi:DNA-binding XRE family transcriptional regulator
VRGSTENRAMIAQNIMLDGKPYVVLPRAEYDRLSTLAKAGDLPPLPKPDSRGNYPAVEYARASLARKLIRDRVAAGLNQRELATKAGVRVETVCRIETGKHTPSVPTIDKIDRALKLHAKSKTKRRGAG